MVSKRASPYLRHLDRLGPSSQVSVRDGRLFFSGDFYCPTRAKTILNQAVRAGTIKPVIAERIYQFMVDISRKGVDFAFCKTSKPTAEKYIEILSSLGVNPIPIPRNKGIPVLENPLRDFYEGGCVA